MTALNPRSRAASLLLRIHLGVGFCPGRYFPGDTIRKAFDKLYEIAFLQTRNGRIVVTAEGKAYLDAHHLEISLGD